LNLEIEERASRTGGKLIQTNGNQSNYDLHEESFVEERVGLCHNATNDDLNNPTFMQMDEPEPDYPWTNYYWLPVEERNFLWNAAREK